jgi:hypothetical protein
MPSLAGLALATRAPQAASWRGPPRPPAQRSGHEQGQGAPVGWRWKVRVKASAISFVIRHFKYFSKFSCTFNKNILKIADKIVK